VLDAQRSNQRESARVHQELGVRRLYYQHDPGGPSKKQDMRDLTRREFLEESLKIGGAFRVAAFGFLQSTVSNRRKDDAGD
jgi:hypothetical protein